MTFENCHSEVKLIAGYTKAGGLVAYEYSYGYPCVDFLSCTFAGSLLVVDTEKTVPSPGTTGWGGLIRWTTAGACGGGGGVTKFVDCKQIGEVTKQTLDTSIDTTFGQFVGHANGSIALSGDNFMTTDNVAFKWDDSVGSDGSGKIGYGQVFINSINNEDLGMLSVVRVCTHDDNVKRMTDVKVLCNKLAQDESKIVLSADEDLTIDCAIGDAYVFDSSGNQLSGVYSGGTMKTYVGK